ncbi:MAG: FkbM family methyltransferase [Verrucomicrobia bacterium]|nr:FkbM family methyltransferase [Verrucomicrobiota bacterium]
MNLRSFLKYWLRRDTTQHGEFALMQKLAASGGPRVFVDVGANDGFYGSNSFPFVARGWRALLIEPHPGPFAKLQKLHAGKPNVTMLNLACADAPGKLPLWIGTDGDEGTLATLCTDDHPHFQKARTDQNVLVTVERLDAVLSGQKIPTDFAILSIDTEGMDYEVLLGLDLTVWRPRVIVTEDYPPKDAVKADYLRRHGYTHRQQIGANAFWTSDKA